MKGSSLSVISLLLLLPACGDASYFKMAGYTSRTQLQVDKAYAARDQCLARNAIPTDASGTSRQQIAQAVALACQPQIDQLISVSNPSHDPRIADAIRRDSTFRALGYVMKAEGIAGR